MRLGFSIAINVNSEILLINEVLAVGDASFVPKCLDKINEFRRHGKTIIFVSHDLSTIERICDEVVWIKKGLVEMRGYPFDYHHFQYSFRVTSSHRDVGIARIPHRWEFSDNIAFKKKKIHEGVSTLKRELDGRKGEAIVFTNGVFDLIH